MQHWGCSAKQLRISTALNRRFYYFLTADERVGDLMREQIEAARTLRTVQPGRKLADAAEPAPRRSRTATSRISASARTGARWPAPGSPSGNARAIRKCATGCIASMKTIGAQPRGFFTRRRAAESRSPAPSTSPKHDKVSVSHLSAAFGLPEICAELIELLDVPEFERAWLQYCELYNAPAEEQKAALGQELRGTNLQQGHARLTAFAAYRKKDANSPRAPGVNSPTGARATAAARQFAAKRIEGPAVLNPVDEGPGISTNSSAQWGLAGIVCLAYTRKMMRDDAHEPSSALSCCTRRYVWDRPYLCALSTGAQAPAAATHARSCRFPAWAKPAKRLSTGISGSTAAAAAASGSASWFPRNGSSRVSGRTTTARRAAANPTTIR